MKTRKKYIIIILIIFLSFFNNIVIARGIDEVFVIGEEFISEGGRRYSKLY